MRVYLVDGTFEVFRCFHGAPRARAADGREVGATRGLLQTLVKLLRKTDVTHVAVAFDRALAPVRPTAGADAPLQSQFGLAADVVRGLGMTLWGMIRYQADDAIATAVARFAPDPRVERIVVCSNDKDFAQCVAGDRVVLLNRITGEVTDEAGVLDRFGVPPALVPEFLALVGDPSDGLPGIPGWGPKSTAAVLRRYGAIDAIPADADDWKVEVRGATRLAAMLASRRDEALLYRNLSVLRSDVPLPHALEDLEWRGADADLLPPLAERIGETALLEKIPRWRGRSS